MDSLEAFLFMEKGGRIVLSRYFGHEWLRNCPDFPLFVHMVVQPAADATTSSGEFIADAYLGDDRRMPEAEVV